MHLSIYTCLDGAFANLQPHTAGVPHSIVLGNATPTSPPPPPPPPPTTTTAAAATTYITMGTSPGNNSGSETANRFALWMEKLT